MDDQADDTPAVKRSSGSTPPILLPLPGVLDADDIAAVLLIVERIAAAKTTTV